MEMELEIMPEPSEEERAAIVAALTDVEDEDSVWAAAALPQRIVTSEE